MRYVVVEDFGGVGDTDAANYRVAELIETAGPLGPWATHYRLLHTRAITWSQAESAVIAMNRGETSAAMQIWSDE